MESPGTEVVFVKQRSASSVVRWDTREELINRGTHFSNTSMGKQMVTKSVISG